MRYRQAFDIQPGFFRSVRIDQDQTFADRYVITPPFVDIVDRLFRGLVGQGSRALSVTGPYGTGKSAALMMAAELLAHNNPVVEASLYAYRSDLMQQLRDLPSVTPILINCLPGPLGPQILNRVRALDNNVANSASASSGLGDAPSWDNAVEALLALAQRRGNLLIVLDEVGKVLEYAASHPDNNDVYILQLLAEAADRSPLGHGLLVTTVLHQSFEEYGNRLIRTQRQEFAKIQGRFEDFAFQLPVGDTMTLIGHAIKPLRKNAKALRPIVQAVGSIADRLYDLHRPTIALPRTAFRRFCEDAAPLHPAVTLLLGPLFRQLAQNERSLFGFLGSSEPMGFQSFLDKTELSANAPRLYQLADLFDYLSISMGAAMYRGLYGRRWADIETALLRVEDDPLAHSLVRTLGMMELVQGYHLPSTSHLLALCYDQPMEPVLRGLQEKSLIVYRRFSKSYRLWNGSDIDIEGRLSVARTEGEAPSQAEILTRLMPHQPLVARRHSSETGTLRWFEVQYLNLDDLSALSENVRPQQADGRLYLVLVHPEEPLQDILVPPHPWQLLCLVPVPLTLREAIEELHYLEWVAQNTPEVALDATADREITERRLSLEEYIESVLHQSLWTNDRALTVISAFQTVSIPGHGLNRFLSETCDRLYPQAPQIDCEFVNRNELSSAATAARNDLLRRMITNQSEENLGIVGFPPQLPIYLSVVRETGLHRQVDGHWRFVAPIEGPWKNVWATLVTELSTGYVALDALWSALQEPPYGVRRGMLPIITVAFLVVHRHRASLLEDSVYVAELTQAVIERMIKVPEKFSLHLISLEGPRQQLIQRLAEAHMVPGDFDDRDLLSIVRPLVVFGERLPSSTKHTQRLSRTAIMVRDAILAAKEPSNLILHAIPRALGIDTVEALGSSVQIDTFVIRLRDAIQELATAYDRLLQQLAHILAKAFDYSDTVELADLRRMLTIRAEALQAVTSDLTVKAFAVRLQAEGSDMIWLEGIASAIVGTPPKVWFDRHLDEFSDQLALRVQQFCHHERLIELRTGDDHALIRLGFTTAHGDWERILTISPSERQWADEAATNILDHFDPALLSRQRILVLAAELIRKVSDPVGERKEPEHESITNENASYLESIGR